MALDLKSPRVAIAANITVAAMVAVGVLQVLIRFPWVWILAPLAIYLVGIMIANAISEHRRTHLSERDFQTLETYVNRGAKR